jgi:hypothetical protein
MVPFVQMSFAIHQLKRRICVLFSKLLACSTSAKAAATKRSFIVDKYSSRLGPLLLVIISSEPEFGVHYMGGVALGLFGGVTSVSLGLCTLIRSLGWDEWDGKLIFGMAWPPTQCSIT